MCDTAQFLPPTQFVVTLEMWCSCFSQIGNGTLAFYLNVNILSSGSFVLCHPMLSQVPIFLYFWKIRLYLCRVYSDVLLSLI